MSLSILRKFFLLALPLIAALAVSTGCGCSDDDDDDDDDNDSQPPTVTIDPEADLFNETVEVTIEAEDDKAATPTILFTLDASEPVDDLTAAGTIRAAAPVTLTLSVDTTLKYAAVDEAHNVSEVEVAKFFIDTLTPTAAANPAGGLYGAAQNVAISAYDDNEGPLTVYYTLDGSDPQPDDTTGSTLVAEAPVLDIPITASGELRYLVLDAAENASATQREVYVIDSTVPDVTASPAAMVFGEALDVVLTAVDDLTLVPTIYYTLDGSAPDPDLATTQRGSSPIFLTLTATTTLRFTALDEVGNRPDNKRERYILDDQPPVSHASVAGGDFDSPFTIDLTAADDRAETPLIHYTLNGDDPLPGRAGTQSGPSPIEGLAIDADTTLKFLATDDVGNMETMHVLEYRIDAEGPVVIADPAGGAYAAPQTVSLTAADNLEGSITVFYTLDGTPPTPGEPDTYERPSPVTGIVIEQTTTLIFFGRDTLGNDGAPVTETYLIDQTPPTAAVDIPGGVYQTAPVVTLTAADDVSETPLIHYTLDGTLPIPGLPGVFTGVSPIAGLTLPSSLTLRFTAEDAVGNLSPIYTEIYTIDGQAPTLTIDPAGGYYAGPVTVTITATDQVDKGAVVITYTTDGSAPTPGVSPEAASPLTLIVNTGTTLQALATDEAGNQSGILTEVYGFDTVAPTSSASPAGGSYPTPQEVTITAVDDHTAAPLIYYTLDASPPVPGSAWTYSGVSPVTGIEIPVGSVTILKYLAVDEVGNTGEMHTELYNPQPPTSQIYPPGTEAIGCLTATIVATDEADPAPAVYYRWRQNSGAWTSWTATDSPASVAFCGDGNYLNGTDAFDIEYYAVNSWGIDETVTHSETYVLW